MMQFYGIVGNNDMCILHHNVSGTFEKLHDNITGMTPLWGESHKNEGENDCDKRVAEVSNLDSWKGVIRYDS